MKKSKKPLNYRIKRLKRLYRLKKKKMIVITCAYLAIAVVCLALLAPVGKKTEPVSVSTTDSDTTANSTQITAMQTQAPTAVIDGDIVRFDLDSQRNFNVNYGDFWHVDMSTFEKNMGTPTVKKADYLIYKNVLFDEYLVHAIFYFNNYKFESAVIKFLDTENRKTVISNFQSICGLLTDQYGEPIEKTETFYDFTKYLYGYSSWLQLNSLVNLEVSNPNAKFDMILTYSNPVSSYCPSMESLENLINSVPETVVSTEAPTENIIRRSTDFNANVDYGEYWGVSKSDIINAFGIEDESGNDYLVYRNIFFGAYNSDVVYYFEDNKLCSVGILSCPEYESAYTRFDNIKKLLENKFNKATESYDDDYYDICYSLWETENSDIILRISSRNRFRNTCVITYNSNSYSISISDEMLDFILNGSHETVAPTEPPTENIIGRSTDINANVDYGEYWGMNKVSVKSYFGEPDDDIYGENQLFYKSIMFDAYSSEVIFTFNNNGGLYMVTVNLRSTGNDYMRFWNVKSSLTGEFGTPDTENRSYTMWITPKSQIKMYASAITYTQNTN